MATEFLQQVQSVMENRFCTDPILTDTACDVWVDEVTRLFVVKLTMPYTETGTVDEYFMIHYVYPDINGGPSTVVPVSDAPKAIKIITTDDTANEDIINYIISVAESVAA
tara:strand:+ start:300 stop:629 length:330 start_codon:yes stop_codon:yes gene_type:complete